MRQDPFDPINLSLIVRTRKRYARRISVMSNQTHTLADGTANINFSTSVKNQQQPKRDSRPTIAEEDQTTDWVPEIPFWNVSIASFTLVLIHSFSEINMISLQLNDSDETQNDGAKTNDTDDPENISPVTATEEDVDEFIDQNIQINSNKQMRIEYLYPWTLKFKDGLQESKYGQLREDMFRSNMLCVFIVWIFIILCQSIIIPRCIHLVICLALATVVLTFACILVMAEEFSCLPILLQRSSATLVHNRNRRTVFICAVIVLMSAASSIGLFLCNMEKSLADPQWNANQGSVLILNTGLMALNRSNETENQYNNSHRNHSIKINQFSAQNLNNIQNYRNKTSEKVLDNGKNELKNSSNYILNVTDLETSADNSFMNESCSHPEYVVFTWVLCLIALATGLKLYYLVKTFMATFMVCCYAILITIVFNDVFVQASTESEENTKYGIPLPVRMNILLIVFLTMVAYHARLVEVTSRLDFIWKEQAEKELSNMKSNRILNDLLIKVSLANQFPI